MDGDWEEVSHFSFSFASLSLCAEAEEPYPTPQAGLQPRGLRHFHLNTMLKYSLIGRASAPSASWASSASNARIDICIR